MRTAPGLAPSVPPVKLCSTVYAPCELATTENARTLAAIVALKLQPANSWESFGRAIIGTSSIHHGGTRPSVNHSAPSGSARYPVADVFMSLNPRPADRTSADRHHRNDLRDQRDD